MYCITQIENNTVNKKVAELISETLKLNNNKKVTIEIKKFYKKRTLNANSYYWAVIVRNWAREYLGDENALQPMHDILGQWFRQREYINKLTGQVIQYTLSTTAMNTVEFSSYMQNCMLKGNEQGIEFESSEEFYEK